MTQTFEMTGKHYEYCEKEGKICYSEREARQVLNNARKTNYSGRYKKRSTGKIPKRIYWCQHCGCFHTTSQLAKKVYNGWGYKPKRA